MPKTVKQTLQGADLDITGYYTLDRLKLMQHIEDDCRDAIIFAGRNHPDKLFLTMQQFQVLEHDTTRLAETELRIYKTRRGFVMEVHILDKPDWHELLANGEGLELYDDDGNELGSFEDGVDTEDSDGTTH